MNNSADAIRLKQLTRLLMTELESSGSRARVVPVGRLENLRTDIEKLRKAGEFDDHFDREWLTSFEFDVLTQDPDARSIIVVAVPHPHLIVTFHKDGQRLPVVIPPTYSAKVDQRIEAILQGVLSPAGYRLFRRSLPVKSLAVHSGLAKYGKNNITYVDGMGSYHRLMAFYTDCPCLEADWQEMKFLEECESCQACRNNCPTGAIADDRFLLRAERCLTFHNEHDDDFPDWIDKSWHHCLIGCLYCQSYCPVNRKVPISVENGPSFDSEETTLVLSGVTEKDLPQALRDKLREFIFFDDLPRVARNVRMLIEIPENRERGLALLPGEGVCDAIE
ncbi:MAG: hypothetical protein JSU74_12770 [Candidatus Zixiibacteriota bacterium]|nr:MAG: hypothetical protein JSU74_12770 [candidate division Zixibacteria bacterium]